MDFEYSYEALGEGESQYEADLAKHATVVTAKYVQAVCPIDRGNPFVEALPPPLMTNEDVLNAYYQPLEGYSEEDRKLSSEHRMLLLSQLRQLRLPLPFHKNLEIFFHDALCLSYRARNYVNYKKSFCCALNEEQLTLRGVLKGDLADAANPGMAVIGHSGCGKSSAMKILLSKYPKVIVHDVDGGQVPQIVYLMVSCVPNSNFSALYAGIGRAIDEALGTPHIFENEIQKQRKLGDKLNKVIELVERFAIGIIIFDEIQLIDFSSTKEASFESLMTLTNQTKVAVAAVGTEDAYAKMFAEVRTARRVGVTISGSQYCHSKEYCRTLVEFMFDFQWFDKRIEVTDEIFNAFYENTFGIVDQLIGLYILVQLVYLGTNPRPAINAAFIEKVYNTYYSGLKALLRNIADPLAQEEIRRINENAKLKLEMELDKARQTIQANELMQNREKIHRVNMQKSVLKLLKDATAIYSISDINNAFLDVWDRFPDSRDDAYDLAGKVMEKVTKPSGQTKASGRSSKKKAAKPSMDEMIADLTK